MRLFELRDHTTGERWELHPRLSVIEADPETRARLVASIERMYTSVHSEPLGSAEIHGILIELDGSTTSMLALDGAVDPIVRPSDLPRRVPPAAQRKARKRQRDLTRVSDARRSMTEELGAALTLLSQAQRQLDDFHANDPRQVRTQWATAQRQLLANEAEYERLQSELDRSKAMEASLAEKLATYPDAIATALATLESANGEAEEAAAILAATQARYAELATEQIPDPAGTTWRDPLEVQSDLDAAMARFEASRDAVDALIAQRESVSAALERLTAERAELVDALARLDRSDPTAVFVALDDIENGGIAETVPDPEAQRLATALVDTEDRRRSMLENATNQTVDQRRDEVLGRLQRAQEELAAAQRVGQRAMLDPEVRQQIERVHEEVLDAQEKADRKILGGNAKKRVVELREREEMLLATHGLASFSDYLLTSSTAGKPDPAAELRFTMARRDVAEAERLLSLIDTGGGPDPRVVEVEARLAALAKSAVALLGEEPDSDLVTALRARRIVPNDREATLVDALRSVGIVPGRGSALDAARAWLADREQSDEQHRDLTARLDRVEADLGALVLVDDEQLRSLDLDAAATADIVYELRAELAASTEFAEAHRAELVAREQQRLAIAASLSELEARRSEASEAAALAKAARDRHNELVTGEALVTEEHRGQRHRQVDLERRIAVTHERRTELELLVADVHFTDRDESDARLDVLDGEVIKLTALVERLRHDADRIDGEIAEIASDEPAEEGEIDPEAVEFFVLSRLASQRSVGFVGSVPLVFDDALSALEPVDLVGLLDRIDRLTGTIQVLYLTDSSDVLEWARALRPGQGSLARHLQPV